MADNEIRLVSKIIRSGDIVPVVDRGITREWFVNPEAREMFSYCLDHWQKYGQVPVANTVRDVLPGCNILQVDEAYDYLIDTFVEFNRRGRITKMLQDAIDLEDAEEFDAVLSLVTKRLTEIESLNITAQDVDLTKNVEERLLEYRNGVGTGGMVGISTGFPTMDKATQGLQPEQLVTVVAQPKCGKSTFMLRIARNIWEQGYRVMVVSFEMSNAEQMRRHDSMATGIAHSTFVKGDFADYELTRLEKRLLPMQDVDNGFIFVADASGNATLAAIAAKIEQHKPDVVLVDGMYLMYDQETRASGTREALTNLTRGFKRLAQKTHIPIVISTQALTWKMQGGNLKADSIGYSSSFFQDSDVIFGLQHVDEDLAPDERLLKILASRACPNDEVVLRWDWDTATFEELKL